MELIHTCYRIGDIDRSVAFYEALGFEERSRMPIRDEAINVFMGVPGDRDRLELTAEELREDVELLNVVNFGGGTYVLYAEILGDEIEVDSQPYGDNFARPARLLPLEAKALVAAIDLFGDHLPQGGLQSARAKIVEALGHDPSEEGLEIASGSGGDAEVARVVNDAIASRRVLELQYYKENEDQFTKRSVEPYRLENGKEGWYVECYDLKKEGVRHFKLDRIKEATLSESGFEPRPEVEELAGVEGWMTHGEVPTASVARVWVSPERARWLREERTVVEELADGAVVIELPYAGTSWLVREILRGAGDLVVLAVWYQAVPDVLARYGDQLDGKIVVDITNPVDPDTYAPLTVEAGSVAQEIANAVPGAKVVKAFNHIYAAQITTDGQPAGSKNRRALVIAGDDPAAKATVTKLLDEFGFDTVDAGPLKEGWRIQRDTPGYGPRRTAEELRKDLAAAKRYADQ